MDNPPPPKPAYTFGHAAHKLVLGEGAEILEVDAPDWRSKEAREARAQACNGVAPMLTKELDVARNMAALVKTHPLAGPLFARGHAEKSIYHTDPKTGVQLRARADWLTIWDFGDGERNVIVDYKTSDTANPNQLGRKFYNFGYYMQAAWYLDAVKAVLKARDPVFLFVVQEKDPPHLVTVIEYDAEAICEGRRRNREAIDIYVRCVADNVWPGYGDTIHPMSLPPWALDDEEIVIP